MKLCDVCQQNPSLTQRKKCHKCYLLRRSEIYYLKKSIKPAKNPKICIICKLNPVYNFNAKVCSKVCYKKMIYNRKVRKQKMKKQKEQEKEILEDSDSDEQFAKNWRINKKQKTP